MSLKKHLTALFLLLLYSLVYGQENVKYYKFQTAIVETVEKENFSTINKITLNPLKFNNIVESHSTIAYEKKSFPSVD